MLHYVTHKYAHTFRGNTKIDQVAQIESTIKFKTAYITTQLDMETLMLHCTPNIIPFVIV